MKKVKAINDNIILEINDDLSNGVSEIIQIVKDDRRTFKKGTVVSVGPDVENIEVGDKVIVPETVEYFFVDLNDNPNEPTKLYRVMEQDIYCKDNDSQ